MMLSKQKYTDFPAIWNLFSSTSKFFLKPEILSVIHTKEFSNNINPSKKTDEIPTKSQIPENPSKTAEISPAPKFNLSPKIKLIADRLITGDRAALAKSITIIESKRYEHHVQAQELLGYLSYMKEKQNLAEQPKKIAPSQAITTVGLGKLRKQRKNTLRIGISGPPGAGKSTFIEHFGSLLTSHGHKVAVLAVDPSSTRTGGSILGDKTRMEKLSRDPNAFIRPSPSEGFLGGVTANSFEIITLCESAGYDIVLIETVGVGQSEVQIADLSDIVLLLVNPGSGDDLQGIKRGIVEIADLVLVTKFDGDLEFAARRTKMDYEHALHYMRPTWPFWRPEVMLTSIKNEALYTTVWGKILEFVNVMKENNIFEDKRKKQRNQWLWKQISEELTAKLYHQPDIVSKISEMEKKVADGTIQPRLAADLILMSFLQHAGMPSNKKTEQFNNDVNSNIGANANVVREAAANLNIQMGKKSKL